MRGVWFIITGIGGVGELVSGSRYKNDYLAKEAWAGSALVNWTVCTFTGCKIIQPVVQMKLASRGDPKGHPAPREVTSK